MPVRPRDASSLVIVRGEGEGTEVLLGRREPKGRFMPNVYVFPGGAVDAEDARAPVHSELRDAVATRLQHTCSPARARALAVAAVRETYEETGLCFGDVEGDALRPALGGLDYVARAITPAFLPRRFHARFFVARAEEASGELGGSGELLDLRFVPLKDAFDLRVVDVTEFVLRHVGAWVAGERRAELPLYHYKNSKAHVRWDDVPGD